MKFIAPPSKKSCCFKDAVTNLLRTIDTPLNRATLFSGELGRGPRCCFHASNWIKAKASDKHAQHHEPHSIISKPSPKLLLLKLQKSLIRLADLRHGLFGYW